MCKFKLLILIRFLFITIALICLSWNYRRVFGIRYLEGPVFILLAFSGLVWAFTDRWRQLVTILALYLIIAYGPVSLVLSHHYGYPRFIPVVMGYPSPEAVDAYQKGEIWLGGCTVFGNEPKWIVVW